MRPYLLALAAFPAMAVAAPPRGDFLRLEKVATVDVVPGGFATALVTLTVKPGFHVQANPAANPQLVATTLTLPEPKDGVTLGPVDYPPGQPYRLRGSDKTLSTYSGSVTLQVSVAARKAAKRGPRKLATSLRYQACDDTTCFFPQTDAIDIPVKVVTVTKTKAAVQQKR